MKLCKLLKKVNGYTPANWVPCEPIIVKEPTTFAELEQRNAEIMKNRNGMSWYLSFKEPDKCINAGNEDCKRLENGKQSRIV